jgi:hypothetical protein
MVMWVSCHFDIIWAVASCTFLFTFWSVTGQGLFALFGRLVHLAMPGSFVHLARKSGGAWKGFIEQWQAWHGVAAGLQGKSCLACGSWSGRRSGAERARMCVNRVLRVRRCARRSVACSRVRAWAAVGRCSTGGASRHRTGTVSLDG